MYKSISARVTPIVLRFKGNETIKEVYNLHIKEFKQTLMAMLSPAMLDQIRLELLELQSIVENKQNQLWIAENDK